MYFSVFFPLKLIKMAPVQGSEQKVKLSYSKITATKSGSRNTRSKRSAECNADMDLKKVVNMDGNKSEATDTVEEVKKEPWFEDKMPGDGKAENSFSVLYNSTSSWENDSESSKNKSWFDLVEEDEAESKNQSLNLSVGEHNTSDKHTDMLGIKIKEEVIDEADDEDHCEATTEHLPVLTDLPIVVKQEKNIDYSKEKEKCAIIGQTQEKSLEKARPQQNLEERQEKQLDIVPLKRERNSSNIGRVDSHRKGKRIKQEVDEEQTEVPLAKLNENACTNDKLIKQPIDKYTKTTQIKIKDESNSKGSDNEDDSDLCIRNRKRALDNSTESVNVKRERNASSSSSNNSIPLKKEYENDPEILARRQKQIDYGKNTLGYDRYRQQIPREMRTVRHPRTPPKHLKYSRRGWDGMVRIWRQQLHGWDPASETGNIRDSVSDISLELGSVTSSDDAISDCPLNEHTKLSTSTPSGSVSNIDIGAGDYLDLDIEEFNDVIV